MSGSTLVNCPGFPYGNITSQTVTQVKALIILLWCSTTSTVQCSCNRTPTTKPVHCHKPALTIDSQYHPGTKYYMEQLYAL